MKAIQYVGKCAERLDNMADTGLVWKQGQVHVVTDQAAAILTKYPDTWAEVEIADAMAAKPVPDVTDSKPKAIQKDEPTPFEKVNTRDMSLSQLREFARSHMNETLPPRITEETARSKVNDLLKVYRRKTREE